MITIYSKTNRHPVANLVNTADQALGALSEAVELIEASGRSAVTERAILESLRAALDRVDPAQLAPVQTDEEVGV